MGYRTGKMVWISGLNWKKHKKDMGILGMIQFAIANQASQETIDGLINKL